MTKQYATVAQTIAIHKDLAEALTVVGEGQCRYRDGFSDKTLAELHDVKPAHVAHIRREIFGQLIPARRGVKTMAERVDDLEKRITELERRG